MTMSRQRTEGVDAGHDPWWTPRRAGLHFAFLFLVASALALATPPFQVPDEQQHFFRAFQLSEGKLRGETRGGRSGGVLPASLGEMAVAYLGSPQEHLDKREIGVFPAATTWARLGVPLEPARRAFLAFNNAAAYAPLAYAPQIVGIEMGRVFGAGPLALLFFARFANALVAALLMATAGLILPCGRLILIGASLLPMTLALFGSASPDAAIIGSCFVFCAIVARATDAGRWSAGDVAACCVAGALVCTIKPVYAPMLLLGLPAALRPGAARNVIAAHATILTLVLGASAVWLAVVATKTLPLREGVDPAAQLAGLLAHPSRLPRLLAATVEHYWLLWGLQFIGKLGWLNVSLPLWMYGLAIVAFLAALLGGGADGARPGWIEALWALATAAGCFALVLISVYVLWTPVGHPMIQGVQGRYFLPIVAMLAVAIGRLRPSGGFRAAPVAVALAAFAIEAIASTPIILSTYAVV